MPTITSGMTTTSNVGAPRMVSELHSKAIKRIKSQKGKKNEGKSKRRIQNPAGEWETLAKSISLG